MGLSRYGNGCTVSIWGTHTSCHDQGGHVAEHEVSMTDPLSAMRAFWEHVISLCLIQLQQEDDAALKMQP